MIRLQILHFANRCGLMFEHQTLFADNRFLYSLLAVAVKLSLALYRPSQEVMQAHPWEANHIFQGVDALISVEGSHLFQGF